MTIAQAPMLNEPVATYKGFVVYATKSAQGQYFSTSSWDELTTPTRDTITEVQRDIWIYWNPRGNAHD